MIIELCIFSLAILMYGFLITVSIYGINKLNNSVISNKLLLDPPFISIVVSVRNEENNVNSFINEIDKQTYSKQHFELIIIDDNSNDATNTFFTKRLKQSSISHQLIKQGDHKGKKRNIAEAINMAKGSIIITTDGDVVCRNQNWLNVIANYFERHNPNLLIMPVDFLEENNLLNFFQITENIALTGIAAGFCGINKPFLCSGANLAFTKKAFDSVDGYSGHINISSGEDIFLLEDLKNLGIEKIQYSFQKELIVKTKSVKSIPHFINQRLRWAYKAKFNTNYLNISFGAIVLISNLLFLALAVAILKRQPIIGYLSIFTFTKLIFDFLLLFLTSKFLGKGKYIVFLLPFECVYWLYTIIIGLGSFFIKPNWKGIKVS